MANGNGVVTLKQVLTAIALIGVLITAGGVIHTKADREELIRVEQRCNDKIKFVQSELKEDIKELKQTQDKIYYLLLEIHEKKG